MGTEMLETAPQKADPSLRPAPVPSRDCGTERARKSAGLRSGWHAFAGYDEL
jgi:hypothetical protein